MCNSNTNLDGFICELLNCTFLTETPTPTPIHHSTVQTTVEFPWNKKKSVLGILNEPFVGCEVTVPIANLLEKIDNDVKILNTSRPLSNATLKMLRENLILEWVHQSNSIEGFTTNQKEVKMVFEGLTGSCKSHTEFFAILNHRDAIKYMIEIIRTKEELTEFQIRNIHSILMTNIRPEIAGSYRQSDVFIRGAKTDPPESGYVPTLMSSLVAWHRQADQMHPIVRSAILHTRFVMIHPFLDGNGRTGRLIMNYDIMKYDYPPAIITMNDRSFYYKAIETACLSNNYTDIIWLITNAVHNSLQIYLKYISQTN